MEQHPSDTLDLTGRTAVITGAASGIGREMALSFARHGAAIVVADLQPGPRRGGEPTADLVNGQLDGLATFVECDVTQRSQVAAAVDAAEEFGGIDIMVNNAGIFRSQPLLDISESDVDRLIAVNVKGVFFGCQEAARRMWDRGGSIINMSSVAGLRGSAPFSAYCASKGAVRLLTYALAEELGPRGIRVNAVHPGLIDTAMTTEDVSIVHGESEEEFLAQIPMGRVGAPRDVAGVALFLASDLAGYVNGASFVADGGLYRS